MSPAFRVEEGDSVTVGQCRPLSKTVCCNSEIGEGWERGERCGEKDGLMIVGVV